MRLAGPIQSWGSESRFVHRRTEPMPTKSGVLGLVAAAKGIRRLDPIEELVGLRMGVRIDQPGQLVRDFQTARRSVKERNGTIRWEPLPVSHRYYLSDAVFLVVLEGDRRLLEGVDQALQEPQFPLYLGRRSCPPTQPLRLGIFDVDLEEGLAGIDWQAGTHHQRQRRGRVVALETVRDVKKGEKGTETIHDHPVSFDPNRRLHAWRTVIRETVQVTNPFGREEPRAEHDPIEAAGG